ncbi:class I SAM-dependent methyltransferase [Rubrivirga sp. S365]|uniref:Class I SAM-dependent methyltransferase n=1 Tax=Rubrivirga litoralis TaxID=3075598 RepID=A0ABU3BVB2_9BACT|nr:MULTISPECIES: class I SAM-dependent methyltransferase [unclassified Rubrivirga]MDT0633170.1 class I SAM-dependent methyltransferase [Rubrivirga sp. F394]MDT7858015.1 class I SAM-dependent methyltransferase [Rubrivirga sp. S365]
MSAACRVCGAPGPHPALVAREMMYGTRERFEYFACAVCGCLQIAHVPADLSAYYPADYYSFGAEAPGPLRRLAKRQRLRHALGLPSLGGALLTRRYGAPYVGRWLAPLRPALDSRILDVGSGAGHVLFELRDAGFTSLTGADPYAPDEVDSGGVRILQQSIHEVEGTFDLVMLHHTFEHLADPAETLASAERLLRSGGQVLLRIPVADSYAFRTYGAAWVQLDAPRHLFLHTRDSIGRLAAGAGLEVRAVTCDSSAFGLWGSEQYRQDIALRDPRSYEVDPAASPFSPADVEAFERQAAALNRAGHGDQACFTLARPAR